MIRFHANHTVINVNGLKSEISTEIKPMKFDHSEQGDPTIIPLLFHPVG